MQEYSIYGEVHGGTKSYIFLFDGLGAWIDVETLCACCFVYIPPEKWMLCFIFPACLIIGFVSQQVQYTSKDQPFCAYDSSTPLRSLHFSIGDVI